MSSAPFPHPLVSLKRQIRHDPVLGHAFVAGIHRRVPHEHGAYFSVTNAQGFREDHDLEPPPEGFHVMCYGDSYTAGDGVDNGERFSKLLGTQLGPVVSNVAVPGHGPDQNVLQLERTSLPRPDLIVWGIAVHTIERIQESKRITIDREGRLWHVDRPHFVLQSDDRLELHAVPIAERGDLLVEAPFPQIQRPVAATVLEVVAKLRSRLVALVGPYLKPAPDPDYEDPGSPGWRLMAALIRRFHGAAGDVPVAVVPLPTSRYLVENQEVHFQRRFAELDDPAAGLHVLDVVTGMRCAPRRERADFCYRLDGHYTAAGHVAVAAALGEQLRLRGLVPENEATTAERVAPAAPRDDKTLHVGWQLEDASAWLCARGDGEVLCEHRESAVTGQAYRPGILPLSAIQACLDEARIRGHELRAVVLHSPCAVGDLVRTDDDSSRWDNPRWFALAAGWIRWRGAAASDVREFLRYEVSIEWETVEWADSSERLDPSADSTPDTSVDDDELRWVRQQIEPLRRETDAGVMERRLLRLAHRWELATRAARQTVLPTTAPLRRGRMAVRLADASNESAPRRGS